jgi:hypothetical protein
MNSSDKQLVLTTQPGWAFATLAEVRSLGATRYLAFHHRDSSVLVGSEPSLIAEKLITPAAVFGCLLHIKASPGEDATDLLVKQLSSGELKAAVIRWLPAIKSKQLRRYSVAAELYGSTTHPRKRLADLMDSALRKAFPRWRRAGSSGVRFLCKADPRTAFLGIQIYSNLQGGGGGYPGSLREHLACGLLTVAGVGPGDTVFDPFMGTGTILNAARGLFQAASCTGLEIDPEPFAIAESVMKGPDYSLFNRSFEEFSSKTLPGNTRLVSTLPFGERFARVPTAKLLRFIAGLGLPPERMVLLTSRRQGMAMAPALGLKAKNVLLLGQPASILHGGAPDARS